MAGEIGYELQGPREFSEEIYAAIMEAGKDLGKCRLGARVANVNYLEACFPTVTDYLPAIFDKSMAEYLAEFRAAMPDFAITFNVAGSYESDDVRSWYRGPVELGWSKNVKFDHNFIGREALEVEIANPKRTIRTLVWNCDDVVDVYASYFRKGKPYHFMEIPRD